MAHKNSFGIVEFDGKESAQELKNQSDIVTEYTFPVSRIITKIDYDKLGLPDGNRIVDNGYGRGIASVPKNSIVKSALLYVTTAANDATKTIDIGLEDIDGTAIDADGLVDGALLATGLKTGAGVLVGAVSSTTKEGFIVASSNGSASDLKGLKGWLVVEFVPAV